MEELLEVFHLTFVKSLWLQRSVHYIGKHVTVTVNKLLCLLKRIYNYIKI